MKENKVSKKGSSRQPEILFYRGWNRQEHDVYCAPGTYSANEEIIIRMLPLLKTQRAHGDEFFNVHLADVISHEYIHYILHREFGWATSGMFDTIANRLHQFGSGF